MSELFRRAVRLVVGVGALGVEIKHDPDEPGQALDIAFDIERTLKPEPNTAEISIWNLNPDHRKALEGLDEVPVSLEAGYQGRTSLLYLGRLRQCSSRRDGPDIITTVSSGDGEKEQKTARVNFASAQGTPPKTVIDQLVRALGLDPGNSQDAALLAAMAQKASIFAQGTVVSGQASAEMTRLCDSLGLEWSVQQGAVQLLLKGKPLLSALLLVSPETGLIGSPSIDNKGVLSAQLLMVPDVVPGCVVQLQSEFINGTFRIEKAKYSGDTAGADWFIDIEAKKL